ncbi:helix-turn-helix domain-containing protein [Marinobacterium ramblicola]|uniref:helix-turn-helix domain-containing protein n=1 Tax=Marinobacterium ramblicola TaxID=2849041 RepID=UPI0024848482|nr:helix-turn-helix transcriptional regulator [Marinobacterium ramblicola]
MTPFGTYLEHLRRSRRMQQKQLADLMGINPCYVSTLERGRKGPPSKAVLKRLIKNLNLSRDEQEQLWHSVELSEMTFRLPDGMSQDEFEFVHDLKSHLGTLSGDQVLIMRKVLGLGSGSQEGIAM